MRRFLIISLIFCFSLLFFSCNNSDPILSETDLSGNPDYLAKTEKTNSSNKVDLDHISILVDQVNAGLEAGGSEMRLTEVWFFTVGYGTDPYMRLRTGARWTVNEVGYILDGSDFTTDVPFNEVDDAMVRSFDSWNNISNSNLHAMRVFDDGTNFDVLDGTIINGEYISLYDLSSPNLIITPDGQLYIMPASDIVVGGWERPEYFSELLGSSDIIGVTWSFSLPDGNSDQYADRVYVEQYYNSAFQWVTSGSQYLSYAYGFDIETIAVHENGHAHGLGHFGGPLLNQKFKLQPNGKIFNPEAVMNPFYLGGEKRIPMPTDVAAIRTMYAR